MMYICLVALNSSLTPPLQNFKISLTISQQFLQPFNISSEVLTDS
ncbi:hypothetical protein JH2_127 [Escherichia phage JH2]|uniref:Uncharacterized protein n=1 Tax=Escherichia phage JH2 TaxID=1340750 RepID=S5MCB1_9CAUD|nr:hypothetical protein AVV43_gp127 [Escherichia phage JH2]AGR48523.1 hypothetical protein JH2_127 [Escherichia phage JH2]